MTQVSAAAFYIERVFAQELSFQGVTDVAALPDTFKVEYAWDWEPRDASTFYVLFGARSLPGKDRPERVTVSMAALFRREGSPQKPMFVDFVMTNAPTILMPYVREAFSNLTARGLLGSYTLPPLNVINLMATFNFELSAGAKKLAPRADVAEAYGVSPEAISRILSLTAVDQPPAAGEPSK